ncbi:MULTISPECIES: prenyltransferase [unclassified Nocardiopsis]|uniref:prenyltransferase n=1 Tax=unclassified Nocardiopsis TaxID=2649073 RepID=UPI00135AF478|nr:MULTISPECIES: prenyltransferase [unclassified Nocardiopsis]
MTWDSFRAAEHFTMRSARLVDRHRFAHLFQSGPTGPVRSALDAYRNIDGGYGNGLDPDLRGHASQPAALDIALRYLDDLGPIPPDLGTGICRYLTTVTNPDGGVPPVLPNVRHTESAPWWRHRDDFTSDLGLTALITGYLHKHNIPHPWRDNATAYCWKRVDALCWTEAHEAIGVCTFLQHVPDRQRALNAVNRLHPMIRAVIDTHPKPRARRHCHNALDLAPHPRHLARGLFTDAELNRALDFTERAQRPDGGWDANGDHWDTAATIEREGMRTIQRLRVLRAYGRVGAFIPPPRRDH